MSAVGHRHSLGWSEPLQGQSAGPWASGPHKAARPTPSPGPRPHAVSSGRPPALRAGLRSDHGSRKESAGVSPQEWVFSDHQRTFFTLILKRWPVGEGPVSMAMCSHPRGLRARVWLLLGWGQQVTPRTDHTPKGVGGHMALPGRGVDATRSWEPGMPSAHPQGSDASYGRGRHTPPPPPVAGGFPSCH